MIAGVEIGPDHPCRTVAEISNNHNGDITLAYDLIRDAKDAGADFVKFQCYTPDELVHLRGDGPAPEPWDDMSMRDLYGIAQTPLDWFDSLAMCASQVGIPWFSSVFGPDSLTVLEDAGCPAYKLSAFEAKNIKLLEMVRSTGKPILRSARANITHIEDTTNLFCPEGYPQAHPRLGTLLRPSSGYSGYSYHGTSHVVPSTAVMCGAKIVEVHFHSQDHPSKLEANVSLTPQKFALMVKRIRAMEAML